MLQYIFPQTVIFSPKKKRVPPFFRLWGLILVPAGCSHLENTEKEERWGEGGCGALCSVFGGGGEDKIDSGKVKARNAA